MADGLTIGVHRIEIVDGPSTDDFEKLMYEQVFPALLAGETAQPADRHLLVGKLAPEGDRVYHWIAWTGYFIHQTPTPTWITARLDALRDAANALVAGYGTFASIETFYDLEPWLQALGTIPRRGA